MRLIEKTGEISKWTKSRSSGFDINAVLRLWDKFDLQLSSLSRLHAKVYIADSKAAFVTSANLTRGGLRENYELDCCVMT